MLTDLTMFGQLDLEPAIRVGSTGRQHGRRPQGRDVGSDLGIERPYDVGQHDLRPGGRLAVRADHHPGQDDPLCTRRLTQQQQDQR